MRCLSKIDESNITSMNLVHDPSRFRFMSFEVQKWGMQFLNKKQAHTVRSNFLFFFTVPLYRSFWSLCNIYETMSQKSPHLWYNLEKLHCWNQRKVLIIIILVLYRNIIIIIIMLSYTYSREGNAFYPQ